MGSFSLHSSEASPPFRPRAWVPVPGADLVTRVGLRLSLGQGLPDRGMLPSAGPGLRVGSPIRRSWGQTKARLRRLLGRSPGQPRPRCVTHPGPVSPSLCLTTPETSADLSEPAPPWPFPGTDQMTPHLGLDVHFSFQKVPNTQSGCGREAARLGAWTLHTQGGLGRGRQFKNWSESQKRGQLVSGVSSRGGRRGCGDQAWAQGLASGVRPGPPQQPCLGPVPRGRWGGGRSLCGCPRSTGHAAELRPELRGSGAKGLGLSERVPSCGMWDIHLPSTASFMRWL